MKFLHWFGILLIVSSLFLSHVGLHNIDIAWNMAYLEYNFDTDLIDITLANEQMEKSEIYRMGSIQCWLGSIMVFVGLAFFIFPIER